MLCPAHKLELAIKDVFTAIGLDSKCNDNHTSIYYLFNKANLNWRLMKRQGIFMHIPVTRYKRPSGTHWVEHQVAALNLHLKNLPIFIRFCDQQILTPHNASMKLARSKRKGIRKNVCNTDRIIYCALKLDILSVIAPMSKILLEAELMSPGLISICSATLKNIVGMLTIFENDGSSALERSLIFPRTTDIINLMRNEEQEIIAELETRGSVVHQEHVSCHGYLLTGSLHDAKEQTSQKAFKILDKLKDSITARFSSIIDDPTFHAMASFLDTQKYHFVNDANDLFKEVLTIQEHFDVQLRSNECVIEKLKPEFHVLFGYVVRNCNGMSPNKVWPYLFNVKSTVRLANILHIAEICIASPLANAESERVFTFLWKLFSKERTLLKTTRLTISSSFAVIETFLPKDTSVL